MKLSKRDFSLLRGRRLKRRGRQNGAPARKVGAAHSVDYPVVGIKQYHIRRSSHKLHYNALFNRLEKVVFALKFKHDAPFKGRHVYAQKPAAVKMLSEHHAEGGRHGGVFGIIPCQRHARGIRRRIYQQAVLARAAHYEHTFVL